MSVFARVLSRAAVPGAAATTPAWPKGSRMPVRRQAAGDDEADAPLQPFAGPATTHRSDDEETVQALRRQEEDEEARTARRQEQEDDEELRTALRQEDEEDAEAGARALRRQEEDEEVRTVRRQAEEEDEEATFTLRRLDDDEEAGRLRRQEEEEDEVEPLRRTGAVRAMASVPVEPLPTSEDGPLDELPDMRALRRDADAPITGNVDSAAADPSAGPGHAIAGPFAPPRFDPPGFDPPGALRPPTTPTTAPPPAPAERPRVTIDQIDVVIHENAPASSGAGPSLADLSRRMRSLYLRRL